MKRLLIAAIAAIAVLPTFAAAQDPELEKYLQAPAIPTSPVVGDPIEPQVTIIETEEEIINEYRVRGRLYMVKIDPVIGQPYYLLDTDGDGRMDVEEEGAKNIAIPQWLLFSW